MICFRAVSSHPEKGGVIIDKGEEERFKLNIRVSVAVSFLYLMTFLKRDGLRRDRVNMIACWSVRPGSCAVRLVKYLESAHVMRRSRV